ncbi:MAG: hypothetical protein P8Z00_16890 [Anaerolineales bacterium]|jgi:hypothetical protein
MIRIVLGAFLVLHGLVHMLYFGQSRRIFEMQPGMIWPDGSWAFSRFLGDATIRNLASILLILAAIGFVAGGAGILAKLTWWRPLVVSVAAFSSILYLLFWNGGLQKLDNQGWIGILINLAILAALLVFQWPNFGLVTE